jgi:peptidoglycan/xylan/chitin deacetylase (PgdA/CDA1 family)
VLGTSRTIELGTAGGLAIGWKTYPETVKLADKEVVLTFDDGPQPGNTDKVLNALKAECVKATFFLIGRNALAHRSLVAREIAEGHSLGNHSWSHPSLTLRGLPEAAAIEEVQRGFAAIADAGRDAQHTLKFFRFPGFADTAPLRKYLAANDVAIFGADLWASDWRTMAPDRQLELLMERLNAERRGIILLHDSRGQTAAMVPNFLRRLKAEGYKVVHLVQGPGKPSELARAPEGWSPETEAILSRVMPRLTGRQHGPAGPAHVAPVRRMPVRVEPNFPTGRRE